MPQYVALDTCSWIYLANGTEPSKYLIEILKLHNSNLIEILVPTLVIEEWNRNKLNKGSITNSVDSTSKILQDLKKSIGFDKKEGKLSFIGNTSQPKSILAKLITSVADLEINIKNAIDKNIEIIDTFFNEKATIIEVDHNVLKRSSDFAIEKKAPLKERNSFADAVILFSVLNYFESKSISSGSFVSANTQDFCVKKKGNIDCMLI